MMKLIKLYSYKNQSILHEGYFENINGCIENAVENKINLSYADLRNLNLTNINLDNAHMSWADFSGSNLTGANLSESILRCAILRNTALYNTCFAYADMQGCDFTGASFGATDLNGCNISFARFSTLSCFNLDFTHVQAMKDCVFISEQKQQNLMSRPPVVIKGISKKPIVMLKNRVLHGHASYDYNQLFMHLNRFLATSGRITEPAVHDGGELSG